MSEYGVTEKGFIAKPISVVREELRDRMKTRLGSDIQTGADSVLGQIIDNYAWEIYRGWNVAQQAYNNAYVSTASGVALDFLAEHIGISRRLDTKASGPVVIKTLSSGYVIPAGTRFAADDGREYETIQESESDTYDGVEFWLAYVNVASIDTGSKQNISAGEALELVNPDSEIDSAEVQEPGVSGGVTGETDNELRRRYFRSIDLPGGSTINSIRAAILEFGKAIDVKMLENTTDVTDGDGLPPHSFEPIILFSGETTANIIGAAILDRKPAGIVSHGELSVVVEDDSGEPREIGYTQAQKELLHAEMILTVDADFDFSEVADRVRDEIVSYIGGNTTEDEDIISQKIGDIVIFKRLYDYIFNVSGVIDVSGLGLALLGEPLLQENIGVGARKFAFIDSSEIAITEA